MKWGLHVSDAQPKKETVFCLPNVAMSPFYSQVKFLGNFPACTIAQRGEQITTPRAALLPPRNRRCDIGRGDKESGRALGGRRPVLSMAYLKKSRPP